MADTYYDGASTGQQIDDTVQKGIILVNCGTITSLPITVTNANILATHVLLDYRMGSPQAQANEWTITTATGSLTITGVINGSTSLTLKLGRYAQSVS